MTATLNRGFASVPESTIMDCTTWCYRSLTLVFLRTCKSLVNGADAEKAWAAVWKSFNQSLDQATKDAGTISGPNVMRIVTSPQQL